MTILLNNTGNPISRDERNKINENWQRIIDGLTNLQMQIKVLAGGQEVDELIARIEKAIENAETDLQNYIEQINSTVQEAIDANNTATQDAITANNQALQIALNTIGATLTDVGNAIHAAETATNDAMDAKDAALQATADAQTTISQMQVIISNFRPRGEWNATTDYFKNNLAGLNGKTYIALQNNTNKPVTDTAFWMLFADRGAKGERGEKGEPGTGIKVLGHFNDVSELPSNPTLGDAYTIGADRDLYVYNGNDWQNLGSIKGVEGKSAYEVAVENGFVGTEIEWLETLIGPPGPDGPPGPPADLTEINQKVDGLQNEVTEHLGQMVLSENGAHGIRFFNNELAVKNNTDQWEVVETGSDLPVATSTVLGGIKPDDITIKVNPETGVASVIAGSDTVKVETVSRTITVGVGKAFTKIQDAINSVGKVIAGKAIIRIQVDAGMYTEELDLSGFSGGGLELRGATSTATTHTIAGSIIVKGCSAKITIQGFHQLGTHNIRINHSNYVTCSNIKNISTSAYTGQGIIADGGSTVYLYQSEITDKNSAILVSENGFVYIQSVSGAGNNIGYNATSGGVILYDSSNTLTASVLSNATKGGAVSPV